MFEVMRFFKGDCSITLQVAQSLGGYLYIFNRYFGLFFDFVYKKNLNLQRSFCSQTTGEKYFYYSFLLNKTNLELSRKK